MIEVPAIVAEPTLFHRAVGGWLAVSRRDSPLKIGVTAETEDEARALFEQAVREWMSLLSQLDVANNHTKIGTSG